MDYLMKRCNVCPFRKVDNRCYYSNASFRKQGRKYSIIKEGKKCRLRDDVILPEEIEPEEVIKVDEIHESETQKRLRKIKERLNI
jgi:hypothetical protein